MKNIFIIIFALFSSLMCFSQDKVEITSKSNIAIQVNKAKLSESSYYGRNLEDCFRNLLDDDHIISRNAFISIEPTVEFGKTKLIEGMETMSVTDMEIGFVLDNKLLNEQVTFSTSTSGRGINSDASNKDGIKSVCRDKKLKTKIKKHLEKYFTELNTTKCNEIVKAIKDLKDANNFNKALMALDFLNNNSECADQKELLEKEILQAHQKFVCDKIIQECSVLIHSSIQKNMEQAVYKLCQVQPNSPCANEAIELTKIIGEKQSKITPKCKEQLDQHIIILNENKQAEWRSAYRNQYYGER